MNLRVDSDWALAFYALLQYFYRLESCYQAAVPIHVLLTPTTPPHTHTQGLDIVGKLDKLPRAVPCAQAEEGWTWYLTSKPRVGQLRTEQEKVVPMETCCLYFGAGVCYWCSFVVCLLFVVGVVVEIC